MGSVIAQVPRPDRSLVRARAHRLQPVAIREPGVTRRLCRRVCVQVAAIAPQLAFEQLSVLMRYTLWSYRLDNRVEAIGFDQAALSRLRDGVAAVVAGGQTDPADPLLADLGRIRGELFRYDRIGDVVARFGEAVRDAVAAEIDQRRLERAVAAGGDPPTAERYLEVAIRNMNYRSFAYVLLALTGEQLTDGQLRCLDVALRHACYAVRLTNDLRGAAQDQACGTLNVLGLRTATGLAVTPGYVWAEAAHQVRAHDTVLLSLTRLGAITELPEQALTRSLAQAVRLYRRTDLR